MQGKGNQSAYIGREREPRLEQRNVLEGGGYTVSNREERVVGVGYRRDQMGKRPWKGSRDFQGRRGGERVT